MIDIFKRVCSELLFGSSDSMIHLTPADNVYIDNLCMGVTEYMRVHRADLYKMMREPYITLKHTCSHGMLEDHFSVGFMWTDGKNQSTIVDANSYCNVIRFMNHYRNSDKYIEDGWNTDDLVTLCNKYALPHVPSDVLYFTITQIEQIRNYLANHVLSTLKQNR